MRSVNKVILIGNVTADPIVKETQSGQKLTTFRLATNREWVNKEDGDKQSLPEFHNIVAWGKLGDLCGRFLRKGKLIYVEGYLKTRVWDTESGEKRTRTEIVIYDMIMLQKRPNEVDFADEENVIEDKADTPKTASTDSVVGDINSIDDIEL